MYRTTQRDTYEAIVRYNGRRTRRFYGFETAVDAAVCYARELQRMQGGGDESDSADQDEGVAAERKIENNAVEDDTADPVVEQVSGEGPGGARWPQSSSGPYSQRKRSAPERLRPTCDPRKRPAWYRKQLEADQAQTEADVGASDSESAEDAAAELEAPSGELRYSQRKRSAPERLPPTCDPRIRPAWYRKQLEAGQAHKEAEVGASEPADDASEELEAAPSDLQRSNAVVQVPTLPSIDHPDSIPPSVGDRVHVEWSAPASARGTYAGVVVEVVVIILNDRGKTDRQIRVRYDDTQETSHLWSHTTLKWQVQRPAAQAGATADARLRATSSSSSSAPAHEPAASVRPRSELARGLTPAHPPESPGAHGRGGADVFRVGDVVEARDRDGNWLVAKVMDVKLGPGGWRQVLVHFKGWHPRFDEWIGVKSGRLRRGPCS